MTVPNFGPLDVADAERAARRRWARLQANRNVIVLTRQGNAPWELATRLPESVEEYANLAVFRADAIWAPAGAAATRVAQRFGGIVVRPGDDSPAAPSTRTRMGNAFLNVRPPGVVVTSYQVIATAGWELVEFSGNREFLAATGAILEVRKQLDIELIPCAFVMVFKGAIWDLGPWGHPKDPQGNADRVGGGVPGDTGEDVAIYVPDSGMPERGGIWPIVPLAPNEVEDTYSDIAQTRLRLDAGHGRFVAGIAHALAPGATVTLSCVGGPFSVGDPDPDLLSVSEYNLYGDTPSFLLEAGIGVEAKLVLNMSMTGHPDGVNGEAIFDAWLSHALDAHPNLIVAAAAGNTGGDVGTLRPASLSQAVLGADPDEFFYRVVSVGAATPPVAGIAMAAGFSNFGPKVNCWATGVDVVSAYVPGTAVDGTIFSNVDPVAKWSGTSFATPIVSVVLADELNKAANAKVAVTNFLTSRRAAGVVVNRDPAIFESNTFIPTP